MDNRGPGSIKRGVQKLHSAKAFGTGSPARLCGQVRRKLLFARSSEVDLWEPGC